MTSLRINLKTFKSLCAELRDAWEDDLAAADFAGKRDLYRDEIGSQRHLFVTEPPAPLTFESIRSDLSARATAAGQYGATKAQVDLLAKLALKAGDRHVMSSGTLTKKTASLLIDSYKR